MKISKLKRAIVIVTIFSCVSVLSSCNRGYGCPTNFSVDQLVEVTVKQMTDQFFRLW